MNHVARRAGGALGRVWVGLCLVLGAGSAIGRAAEAEWESVGGATKEAPKEPPIKARQLMRLFANPPREFASGPLWVWNDRLTEAQIRGTLRDLAGQGVRQAFVHPRPGLMTPYLSEDWFKLWNVALQEAARLDMNIWIYDENSYPSGFAGGGVPEVMPESRGMGLALTPATAAPKWDNALVAAYRVAGGTTENVTAAVRDGVALADGDYLVARIVRSGNSPWHGNRSYVNLLTPGVTEKFIELTLGAYDRHVAEQYGKRIPGVFTDEPNIRPAGGFPWCPDLPERFKERWGYDLLEQLPALVRETGDWRRVRHNYHALLSELFIDRWAKPYYEACEKRGLGFTGHYWDHEWPHCSGVPDNMAMAAWQHFPGIDTLMNQYAENTHAQFGNVRFCREVSSIANQLGRRRTLVELYGAGGWDLRFEDMKRIADWLQVLGVNLMDEHLSYVTVRGARKRDHPQSFSYHEPWWPAYHVHARYLTRLSAALSHGEQVNRILVLEPTTSAWMYQGNEAKLAALGDEFFRLLMKLEAAQVEYDLGCEDVIGRLGSISADAGMRGAWGSAAGLRVGRRQYQVLVLPAHVETLDVKTRRLVNDFLLAGGVVLGLGPAPERTDGRPDPDAMKSPTVKRNWKTTTVDQLLATLAQGASGLPVVVERAAEDRGILFHHRREIADGDVLFLANTSIEHPTRGRIRSRLGGVERWDLYSGRAEPYPFRRVGSGLEAEFELPPSGSLLLFLSRERKDEVPVAVADTTLVPASGTPEVRRIGPNVLTLDYVDVQVGGEKLSDAYFYAANDFVWKRNGMDRNPWDSAVQYKDELISRTFPAGSGFEATYRFTIDGPVPANLAIVIERPDLYTIACNGTSVVPKAGEWWLDRAFGRIPLAKVARAGVNTVTLKAAPFSILHELEAAYVIGDFTLQRADRGWVIGPEQPLRIAGGEGVAMHGNRPDGTMWLSGGIDFTAGVSDRAPEVTFDLGVRTTVTAAQIWNYNEGDVRNLTARGAARVAVFAGAGPEPGELRRVGEFELARADGRSGAPQELKLALGEPVRFLTLRILGNHAGVAYPAVGSPPDNGFVGLAEVRFLDQDGRAVRGVKVAARSGELRSMGRTAEHLVDGSGLETKRGRGWNEQGLPFYAEGVAYRERFKVAERGGRYVVNLPSWYGAVAKVTVNGREAGWISAPPWECDVTQSIRRGDNEVEVTVVGTLKNTLGPHHGGHALGSAWPGMFQKGPMPGPPAGSQYSTVGYGLFEPFLLKRSAAAR